MQPEILSRIITGLIGLARRKVEFIWHGGEPLLAGKGFFRDALDIQRRLQRDELEILNSVQTNATLIDQEWIDFFQSNHFRVGISLDGPSSVHDRQRVDVVGNPSFDQVFRAVELLKKNDVGFGVLAVVTKHSLPFVDEIYRFFVANDIKAIDFLPYVEFNRPTKSISESSLTPSEFAEFVIRIFDLWIEDDDPSVRIRYLENVLTGLLGKAPLLCKFGATCSDYISIDSNGDVYPCDCFIGEESLIFGSIMAEDLDTILNGATRAEYVAKVNAPKEECQNCEWLPICNGGCSRYRYFYADSFAGTNYFCPARKMIFAYINRKVSSILASLGLQPGSSQMLARSLVPRM